MSEKNYVSHTCKNSKLPPVKDSKGKKIAEHKDYCLNAFVDVDKYNAQTLAPTWKYCPECVKKGYKNPKVRNTNLSEKQKESLRLGREKRINSLLEKTA